MIEFKSIAGRAMVASAIFIGFSGCATFEQEQSDVAIDMQQVRSVETLAETIAREQQGQNGCLVAGNLNKGGECKKLRETLSPPAPSSEPQF